MAYVKGLLRQVVVTAEDVDPIGRVMKQVLRLKATLGGSVSQAGLMAVPR